MAQPPVQLAGKLAARLKVMARLDIAERRMPQDGRIKMKLSKTRAIDFRVSTCPTLYGEKIVMRILDPSSAMLGIDALGYEPFQKELYLKYLAKPQGMILVTGPTGSGKTVSLYTGLHILNSEDTNISTAEDPAEINLPGVNQVNVNIKVGLTFASALRSFLRQDPDVIMVGEIRDLETAEIAIKAAQTGHLVLSTLHTNDAPQTLTRLVDMGVKPYAIATSVSLIIAQRLARRLCQHCRVPLDVPAEALRKEGFPEEDICRGIQLFGPKGCQNCTDGYKGRVGIYQVMPVTEEIGRIIMAGGSAIDISDAARKERRLGPAARRACQGRGRAHQPGRSQQRNHRVGFTWRSHPRRSGPSSATSPSSGRARTSAASPCVASPWPGTKPRCASSCVARAWRPARSRSRPRGTRGGKPNAGDIAVFARQLATMLAAGIPHGAVLRHRRRRPRKAVDAEADPGHQGRRRRRHLAA